MDDEYESCLLMILNITEPSDLKFTHLTCYQPSSRVIMVLVVPSGMDP